MQRKHDVWYVFGGRPLLDGCSGTVTNLPPSLLLNSGWLQRAQRVDAAARRRVEDRPVLVLVRLGREPGLCQLLDLRLVAGLADCVCSYCG